MTARIGDNDIYIRDGLYRRCCCYTGDKAEQQLNVNREEEGDKVVWSVGQSVCPLQGTVLRR